MEPKILLTGFKPFSIYPVNPSWEAVKLVKEQAREVAIKELTVDYKTAHFEIISTLDFMKPDILLLSGLADRGTIALETTARKPRALAFVEGSDAFAGSWPWSQTSALLEEQNIHFSISENAGRYVCESVYWTALNYRNRFGYPRFAGFVHVPLLSDAWTLPSIATALTTVLKAARNAHEHT